VLRLFVSLVLLLAVNCGCAHASTKQTAAQAPAAEGFNHPKILAGLTTVSVFVAKPDSWLSSHGVVAANLRSEAVKKLKAAGLKIEPEPASKLLADGDVSTPPVPMVYVKIKSTPEPAGSYAAYSAILTLVDTATTKRGRHDVMVSIWDQNEVGIVKATMNGEIDRAVGFLVDSFLRDYEKANAKPAK
jgi:hypothetical protein